MLNYITVVEVIGQLDTLYFLDELVKVNTIMHILSVEHAHYLK